MVNLLSWREELRQQQKRKFWQIWSGAILAIIFIIVIWSLLLLCRIKEQQDNNENIKQQLNALKARFNVAKNIRRDRDYLLKQTNGLQVLHYNSLRPVKLFQELANIVPKAVRLTELYQHDNSLTLIGRAQFDIGIVEFLENVKQSKLLNNPAVQRVDANNIHGEGFTLKCLIV